METLVAIGISLSIFVGGLLLTDYIDRAGGTMEERIAVVFEVYRYAVCFLMVIVFGLSSFQMVGALLSGVNSTVALAGPGIGVVISGLLFLTHWLLRNPALPKSAPFTSKPKAE